MELPLTETFQPLIPAAISPSLFYLLSPSQGQNTHSYPSQLLEDAQMMKHLNCSIVTALCCFCSGPAETSGCDDGAGSILQQQPDFFILHRPEQTSSWGCLLCPVLW